ncbi:MAG: acyl-[acyl-carrier-protein] thioesterase [Methanococcaceae archaeon]
MIKYILKITSQENIKLEEKFFSEDFEIRYYECNKFKEASPTTVLEFLNEAAGMHSTSVGYGYEALKQNGRVWLLNRWNLKVERYPKWEEKVSVKTWPSNFERCFAKRDFLITDENENTIAKAVSLWIFFDIEKKRPIRIPQEFNENYRVKDFNVMEDTFKEEHKAVSSFDSKRYKVCRDDIDFNNHVYNVRYLNWIINSVPEDIYEECFLDFLDIQYCKEVHYGMDILCNSEQISSGKNSYSFNHAIASPDENLIYAKGRTSWKAR